MVQSVDEHISASLTHTMQAFVPTIVAVIVENDDEIDEVQAGVT